MGRAGSWAIGLMAILTVISCASRSDHASQANRWPAIREMTTAHHFILRKDEAFKCTVYGESGEPLYVLDARIDTDAQSSADYDFSGVLDCRLIEAKGVDRHYPTLFQSDKYATRDWETYGRFTQEDLVGLAGAPSSRSIIQRCWLRGMCIQMEVNNVVVVNDAAWGA